MSLTQERDRTQPSLLRHTESPYSPHNSAVVAAGNLVSWLYRKDEATEFECGQILLAGQEARKAILDRPDAFLAALLQGLEIGVEQFLMEAGLCSVCHGDAADCKCSQPERVSVRVADYDGEGDR